MFQFFILIFFCILSLECDISSSWLIGIILVVIYSSIFILWVYSVYMLQKPMIQYIQIRYHRDGTFSKHNIMYFMKYSYHFQVKKVNNDFYQSIQYLLVNLLMLQCNFSLIIYTELNVFYKMKLGYRILMTSTQNKYPTLI